jgi:hypothetical protein
MKMLASMTVSIIAGSALASTSLTFDDATALEGLKITGSAGIDAAQTHGGAGALKLDAGSRVEITLRDDDGTGRVELWVYEDGAAPGDPKTAAAGAMWGLAQADGHTLAVGPIYAKYLSGDKTYAAGAFNPGKSQRPWQVVQYLGGKRTPGWHKWTFDFDPDQGLRISCDDKDVNASKPMFNWNQSRLNGFTSVVLYGDASGSGQILWVDDMTVTIGPPANVTTLWPPPPTPPPADLTVLPPPATWTATPYAKWKNGPGKSDDFFPIAVWLQEPKDAKLYKAAGINLYFGLWKGPTEEQLAALREAGMPVICEQNETALKHLDDPIIVGWMHGDEPDNAQHIEKYWKNDTDLIARVWPEYGKRNWDTYGPPIAPSQIVESYEAIKRNDPSRPVIVGLGQGVAWPAWKGRGVRSGKLEDYPHYIKGSDIVGFDIYPAAHDNLDVKNALWYVPQGVRHLREWGGDERVVWNAMECTEIDAVGAKPTPEQVKAEVWMSIIHGSRGIYWFVHKFTKPRSTRKLLEDPEMLAMVTAINQQIHQLARVLNSPTIGDGATATSTNPKTPVHVMTKRHGGATYVFAVAMYQEDTDAKIAVKGLAGDAKVEVLGEDRTVAAKDGVIADAFKGNAVHVYKVSN